MSDRTAEQALDLARERFHQTNHAVLDYPVGDTLANSYRPEEHPHGWVFVPAVSGLDRDPVKGEAGYPYYVVPDDGPATTTRYSHGKATAVALLAH